MTVLPFAAKLLKNSPKGGWMEEGPTDFAQQMAVTFINDEPAEEDFFRTHTRLARAISAAIRSNPKLKVIGLLGRWGSGKSTVIHHLKAELSGEPSKPFRVFTYDTWLHQSDPVRRSFLESLHANLIEQKIGSVEVWRPRLEELSGHVETTEIQQTPVLTRDAKWILASLTPLPIAIGLLDLDTVKEAWGSDWTLAGFVAFWLAVTFLALPVLTTIIRYQINKTKGAQSAESFLPLLLNRSVEKITSKTFRSPEPTSIEFGTVFRDVMSEVAKEGIRLVIVIDNLDRLAESDSLQMWATIRSFFLSSHHTDNVGHEPYHPIVILPVDSHALERMFALDNDPDTAKELAASFINKTFDITFTVSEPVLSDWRDFLSRQLGIAFRNGLTEARVHWARRFLEEAARAPKVRITPREINKYVNRVASLYVQWHNEGIPFEILAYYAANVADIESGVLKFVTDQSRDLSRISQSWKNEIAAIHYGVAVDKAAQVLLLEPMKASILENDRSKFVIVTRVPGFREMLREYLEQLRVSADVITFEFITNCAILIEDSDVEHSLVLDEVWRGLISLYPSCEFQAGASNLKGRVAVLLRHAAPETAAELVAAVASDLSAALSGDEPVKQLGALRDAATELVGFANEHGIATPAIQIDAGAARFLSRLVTFSASPLVWPQIRAEIPWEELHPVISQFLKSDDHGLASTIVYTLTRPEAGGLVKGFGTIVWDEVIGAASEILRNPSVAPKSVGSATDVLGVLSAGTDSAWSAVEGLIDEDVVSQRVTQSLQEKDWGALSSFAAQLIWNGNDFAAPGGSSWREVMSQKSDFVQMVHRKVRRYFGQETMYEIWHSYYEAKSSRTLVEGLIRYQVENDTIGEVNIGHVVENLSWYKYPVLYWLEKKFLEIMERSAEFWEELAQAPVDQNLHAAADLVAKGDKADQERISALVRNRLAAATEQDWGQALTSADGPYDLATDTSEMGRLPLGSGSALYKALLQSVPAIVSGADLGLRRRWFELAALLRSRAEKQLFAKLGADLMQKDNLPGQLPLLKVGGASLLKHGGFSNDPDRAIQVLVRPYAKNKAGRAWLKEVCEEVHGWIKRAKDSTRESVLEDLNRLERGKSAEARYWSEVMRASWGLPQSG